MLDQLRGVAEEPSKLLVWLYYRWRFTATRLSGRGSGSALFTPERPLMGYSAWRICHELGLRIVTEPDEHCRVALNWEDVTVNMVQPPTPPNGLRLLNARCVDIRKSTVEAASIATLGYGLAVDPRTHTGPFVRKSEENGLHDGAVVEGPRDPEPGYIDQRLLDNVVDGRAEDFRVTVVGRQTPMIVRRLHKLAERFDTVEIEEQVSAGSLLAPDEVEKLFDFCERIGLDYGDLDVIRDRGDGRLYVLDANKTPWGPPIRLGFRFSVRFHRRLARMFADEFLASPAAEPAGEASG
jgi:hypothetical protein